MLNLLLKELKLAAKNKAYKSMCKDILVVITLIMKVMEIKAKRY